MGLVDCGGPLGAHFPAAMQCLFDCRCDHLKLPVQEPEFLPFHVKEQDLPPELRKPSA